MTKNIKRGIFKLLPFSMVAILAGSLFLFTAVDNNTIQKVFAAADDYTVSGGDPGSLPTVGAASVALGTVTLTDAGGDDFANTSPGEVFSFTINTANYGSVEFDQTVVSGSLTVAGTCGHTSASALTYPNATTANVTVTGAGGAGTCSAGQTVTIAGLKIKTIYAQSAPGANYLISVDNAATSAGNTVNSGTTVNYSVSAADAAASLTLVDGTVGATQNTTLNITVPISMVATDYITFTAQNNLSVSGVSYSSTTFAGGGAFACAYLGSQVVKCTATGAITAGSGTIVMSGITGLYAGTGKTISSIAVYDTSASASTATDSSGSVTDTVEADAAASLTLANGTVGATQNTTLNITAPVDLNGGNYIQFTAPNNLSVASAAYSSDTFAGAGAFTCTNTGGQVIRCTATGSITKGVGTIVMTGITGAYAAAGQTISSVVVYENAASANIATDASGTVTDTTAADAAMALALASPTVGATSNGTLTVTVPVNMAATDYIEFDAPANIDVTAVAIGIGDTFASTGTFTCTNTGGQTIRCTTDGPKFAGTGNIYMTGYRPLYAASGQTLANGIVCDTSASANTAVDSTAGAVTDVAAADAAASLTLANAAVGATQDTTLNITVPVDMAGADYIQFVAPNNLGVGSAAYVSDTFAGAGNFTCTNTGGQTVRCTTDGVITAAAGTIVMSGITGAYVASGQTVSSVVVYDTSASANTATDASGTVTDTTAAALTSANVEPATLVAGATGTATVSFTTTGVVPIPADGKIKVTFGANYDLTSVGAADGTCAGMGGTYVTSVAGQIVTITRQNNGGAVTAGAQTCTIANVTNPSSAGSTGTYSIVASRNTNEVIHEDTAVAADTITAAALSATNVEPATLVVNETGTATATFTTGLAVTANGKIKVTFGANYDLSSVGAADGDCSTMDGTFVTSVAGQVVTITRQNDGASEPAGAQTCTIANVTNPGAAGSTGTYTISTTTSADAVIETDAAVTADTIVADALTSTNVEPATLTPSAIGTADVTFTTVNAVPADGKIKVTFGAGYTVSGVGAASGACASMDGTFVTSVAGQVVTITRQNDGASEPAGAQTCTIASVQNPAAAGSTGTYIIKTTNSTDGVIDEDTAVTADTIISAAVACNDSTDNDGDGLIDLADPGCSSSTDTDETNGGSGGGGGGGGGGGANVISSSNSTTSSVASTITAVNGDQTYSRPVQLSSETIVVDLDNNTKTAQVTEDGTLTIKPNVQSTISLTIPPDTTVEGTMDWNGKIEPPLVKSITTTIDPKGDKIQGSKDKLTQSEVTMVVKVGSDASPLTFSNEVAIEIPVDLPDGTVIDVYSSKDSDVWVYLGQGTVTGGVMVLSTDHLTYFALVKSGETAETPLAETISGFTDIAGHWAQSYIEEIADLGIVSGKSEGIFAPDDAITRAELTKIAVKAFGISVAPAATYSPFNDVGIGAWYTPYLIAAKENGIVSGYGDGTFKPNNRVTRVEALKILILSAGFVVDEEELAEYPDTEAGAWYSKYLAFATANQIVSGYPDGTFRPDNNITRAEVAKIVTKLLGME